MSKNNPLLGSEVNKHLRKLGIQTPMTDRVMEDRDVKVEKITHLMAEVLEVLGLDLTDDSLEETPLRVAKMYVDEVFSGLTDEAFPKCTTVENKFSSGDEFVQEKNITLYSDCEHHLRPIYGVAHVAYCPADKVLGLSKMNRIVQYFARRPQVQERLTHQIAAAISYITGSEDVIVAVDARHMCVSQRGVSDTNSSTQTIAALGRFGKQDSHLRSEFINSIQ
jgi:GTP cyclohydrolase I